MSAIGGGATGRGLVVGDEFRLASAIEAAGLPSGVEHDGAGGGGIEGIDLAAHGDFDDEVTPFADEATEAVPFVADDEGEGAVEVDVAEGLSVGGHIEASDPDFFLLQLLDRFLQIGYLGEEEMFDGTNAIIDDSGIDIGSASVLDNDAVDTTDFGGTEERTHVLGPLDEVEEEEERFFLAGASESEHFVNGGVRVATDFDDNPLMTFILGELGELFFIGVLNRDAERVG